MNMINIFSKTKIPVLEKSLKTYSLRQNAIASNIANVNTPGYRRVEVKFEEKLSDALSDHKLEATVTNEKHIPMHSKDVTNIEPEVVETQPKQGDNASGANNVDIEQEMVLLAQNQIQYRMASRLISRAFKGIQNAIKGSAT
jgi:flagellar basal-body rod protein FlgB